MLAGAAMNGIAIWIMCVIDWFVRVWYAMKNAVEVTAVCDTLITGNASSAAAKKFIFTYEGQKYTVQASGLGKEYSDLTKGQEATLLWIPYSEKAEFSLYKTDEKSKKTLLLCDVLSLVGLVLFLIGFILLGSTIKKKANPELYALVEGVVVGSVVLMIVMSIIRKRCRK